MVCSEGGYVESELSSGAVPNDAVYSSHWSTTSLKMSSLLQQHSTSGLAAKNPNPVNLCVEGSPVFTYHFVLVMFVVLCFLATPLA